jgi:hypothetical protein
MICKLPEKFISYLAPVMDYNRRDNQDIEKNEFA